MFHVPKRCFFQTFPFLKLRGSEQAGTNSRSCPTRCYGVRGNGPGLLRSSATMRRTTVIAPRPDQGTHSAGGTVRAARVVPRGRGGRAARELAAGAGQATARTAQSGTARGTGRRWRSAQCAGTRSIGHHLAAAADERPERAWLRAPHRQPTRLAQSGAARATGRRGPGERSGKAGPDKATDKRARPDSQLRRGQAARWVGSQRTGATLRTGWLRTRTRCGQARRTTRCSCWRTTGPQHAAAAGAQHAAAAPAVRTWAPRSTTIARLHDMLDRCRANEPRGAHVPGDVTGGRETSPLDMAKSFDPNSGKTGFCTHRTHEPAGRRRCHDDAADVRPRSRPRPAPAFPAEYSAGQQCKQGHRNVLCHNLPDARYAQQRSSVDDAQIRSRLPAGAPRHDGSAWRATRVLKAHCMVL